MSIAGAERPIRSVWKRLSPATLGGLVIVAVVHAFAIPRSFWEFDETLFAQAVWNYDPWIHNPPPPGYPLFIGIAKLFNFFTRDPLPVLLGLSFVATIIGFVVLSRAFSEIAGDDLVGVLGAFLFYLSPTMLIHATLPQSDSLALCFFAFVVWTSVRVLRDPSMANALIFGAVSGLNVGVRPQFSIIVVPVLVVTILLARGLRARGWMLAAFTVACLAWFLPLTAEVGGPARLYQYELGQAAYYAAHDATISRGGWSTAKIAGRFIARPWGSVWFAAVVLLLAIAGFLELTRHRMRAFAPLAAGGAAYLGFALGTMDPADGARYALPSVLWVALMAGAGLSAGFSRIIPGSEPRRSRVQRSLILVAAFLLACVSVVYTSSLITQRSTSASPPARAAEWIKRNVPRNAVILVELPLWPHARYFLGDYHLYKIDEGTPQFVQRSDVPVYILADGASAEPDAVTFRWQPSHAYEKLTRNHYRVVSVVPLGPEDRFHAVKGVFGAERDAVESWRWLAPEAELVLPQIGARRAALEFGLTKTAPIADNEITVYVNTRAAGKVTVRRGGSTRIVVPLGAGENRISVRARESFVPAAASGGVGDPRTLAVRLLDLDQER